MKKADKIVVAVAVLLVIVVFPVYFEMLHNARTEGSIQIRGAVGNPEDLTFSQIEAFPNVTTCFGAKSILLLDNGGFNYTGVPLMVVLEQARISPNATSVFIQAPDGFAVTLSIEEAKDANTILAYQKNGAAMTALSAGGEGPVRLVIGGDEFPMRWVKGVSQIEVR
ncbi:MAG TPA: molybdopterin-dependent oxidoreductase [Candidatus Nanoarchaeia archaeon]|nr:molybdopterin-dependent oxidoreductase [Candidatus Nanoarchaeia archaeon]